MKYFLTGATGFIGRNIAERLLREGHEVVALVRNPAKARDLSAMGIHVVQGDVTDKDSVLSGMQGARRVFHIAGWYKIGVHDKHTATAVNVEGTRNVLDAMKTLGIEKGVYTSTLAVNSDTRGRLVDETYEYTGPHLSIYDETKAEAHRVAKAFIDEGLPLVIVQPGLVYGPGDTGPSHNLLMQFLLRKLPMVPQKTAFCWAHVDDIAEGHLLAMSEKGVPGENYFLAGPVCSLIDALKLAEKLSGVPAPSLSAPPWLLKTMSMFMTGIEKIVDVPADYTSEYLRVSAGVTYIGDNAKAKKALGWTPRPLEEGMKETLEYVRKAQERSASP